MLSTKSCGVPIYLTEEEEFNYTDCFTRENQDDPLCLISFSQLSPHRQKVADFRVTSGVTRSRVVVVVSAVGEQ